MKSTLILLCLILGACCPKAVKPTPNPLVSATCTDIQPPADDTFGSTTYALIDLAGKYRKCRAAALGVGDGK